MVTSVLLGLLIAAGLATILGWTADSRDDTYTLWPLRQPAAPTPVATPAAPVGGFR